MQSLYKKKIDGNEPWHGSNKSPEQGYMTDLLQELIASGVPVRAIPVSGGWLEVDTENDYALAQSLVSSGFFDQNG
jgi:NDP-sugar pyrophosphorylase family protein